MFPSFRETISTECIIRILGLYSPPSVQVVLNLFMVEDQQFRITSSFESSYKERGEQGYANPPIRGIFRPDPSIRLNFTVQIRIRVTLKIFRGIQKVALQHEKLNYLPLFSNRNRCGTSCLTRFRYSFKTLSIKDRAIMFLPTIQI